MSKPSTIVATVTWIAIGAWLALFVIAVTALVLALR